LIIGMIAAACSSGTRKGPGRVLFFSRYEASELGSLTINTEHLLLGLLREGKGLTSRIFARANISRANLQKEIEGRTVFQEKVATSVEIPFSADTMRVLQFVAEEADRLSHSYIGTEHLLLGILREERSVAGSILMDKGLRLDEVRDAIVQLLKETPAAAASPPDDQASLVDVYVVTAPSDPGPSLRGPFQAGAGTISWRTSPGGIVSDVSASGATIGVLCSVLEASLGSPFVDRTALTGKYDFEVHNGGSTVDALLRALRDQLGLVATRMTSRR
jgi:hypothetical protein